MENPRFTLRASPAKNECSLQVFKEGLEKEWGTRGEMISGYSFYWDSVYLYCRPTEDKELNEKYSFPMGIYLWFNASEWGFFRTMVWPDLCAAKDPSSVLWFGYNEEISYRADKRDGALIVKYSECSPEAPTEKISYPKDNDDWFKHDPACFKTYDADMEKTETMFSKIDKIFKDDSYKKTLTDPVTRF